MMAQGHFISTILNISSQPPSVVFISAGARWPPYLSCPMNQSPHFMLTCCTCRPLDGCARQKSDETWWKWGVTDNRFSLYKAVPLYRMARKVHYDAAQMPTQARACPLSLAAVCKVVIHLSRWSSVYNPQQQTRVVCMTHVTRRCFSRLTSLHNKVFQVQRDSQKDSTAGEKLTKLKTAQSMLTTEGKRQIMWLQRNWRGPSTHPWVTPTVTTPRQTTAWSKRTQKQP